MTRTKKVARRSTGGKEPKSKWSKYLQSQSSQSQSQSQKDKELGMYKLKIQNYNLVLASIFNIPIPMHKSTKNSIYHIQTLPKQWIMKTVGIHLGTAIVTQTMIMLA